MSLNDPNSTFAAGGPKSGAGSTKTGGLEQKEHGHPPFVARNFLAAVHLAAGVIWLN
jgi:hypothetical protein